MSAPVPPPKRGWLKTAVIALLGLGGGAVGTYSTAVFDKVVKPTKPVANFAVTADGLAVTCQNHASGESGWWDFGDGSQLEPFAPDKPATHTYAKPGTYTVKLTVRNYFADENERSVPVEVAAGPKDAPPPAIAGFAVQPVSAVSVAPATFRVQADVTNAEHCVWDFGDGRLEVTDGGKIDRMVTFDKPGSFGVQLVAHSGKQVVKQAAGVKIDAPQTGTLMAVLRVTDTGTQVDRRTHTESVAVPVPSGKGGPGFSKTLQAKPGYLIVEATPANATVPGVKNLKVQVAADKRSVAVGGEWAGDPKATNKAAGGSDVIVPVKLTEEKASPLQLPAETVSAVFQVVGGQTLATLPLPAPPERVAGLQRKMQLEIRQATGNGQYRTLVTSPDLKLPWSANLDLGPGATSPQNRVYPITAKQNGGTVTVAIGP